MSQPIKGLSFPQQLLKSLSAIDHGGQKRPAPALAKSSREKIDRGLEIKNDPVLQEQESIFADNKRASPG
ncbi:hypothetical protein MAMC_01321 [Methylacidimicrobium cyclopophantes]|uniref:Uncharacterized protein n=1 Tax=Methylacidimicrobium cyclopophantes TaxID=1041766 RepID=A0A5E6MCD4_9BACT|nr:hypothetical protein MAMC_01321 [Methylacidimicrobium cyclopophantes]